MQVTACRQRNLLLSGYFREEHARNKRWNQECAINEIIQNGCVLSKCVSTRSGRSDVLLRLLCTAFYINVRAGMPGYGVKLEC